jgi:hypothetical protein
LFFRQPCSDADQITGETPLNSLLSVCRLA